jgi:hypothetical protein
MRGASPHGNLMSRRKERNDRWNSEFESKKKKGSVNIVCDFLLSIIVLAGSSSRE